MRLYLSALFGSLLVLSACGDSSQAEPDAGMGMGTGVCTNPSDETNCGTIANSRTATAEGCANFDFTRFTTCPQP